MVKEKKHRRNLKKNFKFVLIIAIIIILILTLSLSLFLIGIKFKFVLQDELNILLNPIDKISVINNGGRVEVNFSIKNENFAQCDSFCNFVLTDLSSGKILSEEKYDITHDEIIKRDFSFLAPEFGEGQVVYSFSVECNNKKSFLCLTEEKTRYKNSVIFINYELDATSENLKNNLGGKLNLWLHNSLFL